MSEPPTEKKTHSPKTDDVFVLDPEAELKRARKKLHFEITRRERAEKERDRLLVAERGQQLLAETLGEVSRALNTNLDYKEILHLILKHLAQRVDYDSASVMLLIENNLDVVVRQGSHEQVENYTLNEVAGLLHVQDVLKTRKSVVIPDTSRDSRRKPLSGTEYIRSWLGVPLISKDRVIGLINLNKKEADYYNASDAAFVNSFASQAAIAIENAWLFEETRHRVKRLAALREIDMAITASLDLRVTLKVLLDQVLLTLGVDAADILLLNPLTQTLEINARRGFQTGALRKNHIRLEKVMPAGPRWNAG